MTLEYIPTFLVGNIFFPFQLNLFSLGSLFSLLVSFQPPFFVYRKTQNSSNLTVNFRILQVLSFGLCNQYFDFYRYYLVETGLANRFLSKFLTLL